MTVKESSVDLYYFTGTGNTLLAAREVAETLRKGGKTVRLLRIEKGLRPLEEDCALGIASTIAVFSTYPFVWKALQDLPKGRGRSAFLISTMAGASVGGFRAPLKRLLEKKGYVPLGTGEFLMPSNYARTGPDDGKDRETIEAMRPAAAAFGRELLEGRAKWKGGTPLSSFACWLAGKKFPWRFMARRLPLAVDREKCIQCGKCARLCPVKNIRMETWPVFLDHCVACQRCMGFCPPGAISVEGKNYRQYRTVEYGDLVGEDQRK